MQKEKILFLSAIGGVLLILILYSVITFGRGDKKSRQEDPFESPEMKIDQKRSLYQSRIDALTGSLYDTPERENPLRYDFLAREDSSKAQNKKEKQSKKEEPQQAPGKKSFPRKSPAPVKEATSQKPPDTGSRALASRETEKNPAPPAEETHQVEVRYGFSHGESLQPGAAAPSPKTPASIWGQLDQRGVIGDNTYQVFLLENPATINGHLFPANSKVYTRAKACQGYIDILAHSIRNSNTGEEFPVDLYGVNEDRSRGVKCQGKVNRESDRASQRIISEAAQSIYRGYNLDGVAQAAGEGIEEIASREKLEVPIARGYRLMFIENSSQ